MPFPNRANFRFPTITFSSFLVHYLYLIVREVLLATFLTFILHKDLMMGVKVSQNRSQLD